MGENIVKSISNNQSGNFITNKLISIDKRLLSNPAKQEIKRFKSNCKWNICVAFQRNIK